MSEVQARIGEGDYFAESEDGSMLVRLSDDGGCAINVVQIIRHNQPGFSMADMWNSAFVHLNADQRESLSKILATGAKSEEAQP